MKVAFCDRDGTLVKDYSDSDWSKVSSPEFFEDTVPVLIQLNKLGYEIIVISNQYLINEGYITQKQYDIFTHLFLDFLEDKGVRVLDVFYCPHKRDEGCGCIKPNIGMVEKAVDKYKDINLKQSFIVGDSKVDIELARKLNMKSFGINVRSSYKNNTTVARLSDLLNYV